jgi:hypothetical protein
MLLGAYSVADVKSEYWRSEYWKEIPVSAVPSGSQPKLWAVGRLRLTAAIEAPEKSTSRMLADQNQTHSFACIVASEKSAWSMLVD